MEKQIICYALAEQAGDGPGPVVEEETLRGLIKKIDASTSSGVL